MKGIAKLLTDLIIGLLGADAKTIRSEASVRYNAISWAIWSIIFGLPIFYGAAFVFHLRGIEHIALLLHGVYGALVILCVINIYLNLLAAAGLVALNKKLFEIVLDRAANILEKGGHSADAIAQAIAQAQAKFKSVIDQPTGEWHDMALSAINEMLTPLKLIGQAADEFQQSMANVLRELSKTSKEARKNAKELFDKDIKPWGIVCMNLSFGVIIISFINVVWPWWTNPMAAALMVTTMIGMAFSAHRFEHVKTLDWKAFAARKTNKRLVYVAIIWLIGAALGYSFLTEERHIIIAIGLAFVILIPQIFGLRIGALGTAFVFCLWGMIMPEQWNHLFVISSDSNHSAGMYYKVIAVDGMPKCYMHEADRGGQWAKQYAFKPKSNWEKIPSEVVAFNTVLHRNEGKAVKDTYGKLWIKVIPEDRNGFSENETPFYARLSGKYLMEIPDPETPIFVVKDPTYDYGQNYTRIDGKNTLKLFAVFSGRFGSDFERPTWLGFEPLAENYADPLDYDFETGNGFASDLGKAIRYSGADFVCEVENDPIPVRAAADGYIDDININVPYCLTIAHPGNVWTYYGNLSSIAPTKTGQDVAAGDIIGYIDTGRSTDPYRGKPYLYFAAVRRSNNGLLCPVDPMPILGRAEYPPIPWQITVEEQ